jgi:hypothetical protein
MPQPIPPEEEPRVASWLSERLVRRVGLDVWTQEQSGLLRTDRDTCTRCEDVVELAKQLVRLHPALSWTQYDLDRHANRAEEADVQHPPTIIVRGSSRAIRVEGLPGGIFFPMFLDILWFASTGAAPVTPENRARLQAIEEPVEIVMYGAPYDPYSSQLGTLLAACAVEQAHVHVRIVEASEFPVRAGQQGVTEVPVMTINGRRFVGGWGESELIEQIGRVLAGDDEPVIRDHVLTSPYLNEDDAERMFREQAAAAGGMPPGAPGMPPGAVPPGAAPPPGSGPPPEEPSSGLIVPGR